MRQGNKPLALQDFTVLADVIEGHTKYCQARLIPLLPCTN